MTNYQQEAVKAASQALDDHGWWMTTDDWESLCSCGEVLKPSLEYAGDAYRSHLATVALTAAEPYMRRKWAEEVLKEGVLGAGYSVLMNPNRREHPVTTFTRAVKHMLDLLEGAGE